MSYGLLDKAEFADNPEPRCPVVLLLDCSGSMTGKAIDELNNGLRIFSETLKEDVLASLRVEVAIIAFGGDVQVMDVRGGERHSSFSYADDAFITVDQFEPPTLSANGPTPMGQAVQRGLGLLRERKEIYKQNSVDYYRPWMFLITDGQPTDLWHSAATQVKQEEANKGLIFFGIGIEGANMKLLSEFCGSIPPLKLEGLAFNELFQWLSKSMSAVSQSNVGENQVALPPTPVVLRIDTSH